MKQRMTFPTKFDGLAAITILWTALLPAAEPAGAACRLVENYPEYYYECDDSGSDEQVSHLFRIPADAFGALGQHGGWVSWSLTRGDHAYYTNDKGNRAGIGAVTQAVPEQDMLSDFEGTGCHVSWRYLDNWGCTTPDCGAVSYWSNRIDRTPGALQPITRAVDRSNGESLGNVSRCGDRLVYRESHVNIQGQVTEQYLVSCLDGSIVGQVIASPSQGESIANFSCDATSYQYDLLQSGVPTRIMSGALPFCPSCPAPDMCTGTNAANRCDDGQPCSADSCDPATGNCIHQPEPTTTVCHASAGDCDVEETCDGTDFDCPAEEVLPANTPCRNAAGGCDLAEWCNGSSPDCPTDEFQPSTHECRPAVDRCDEAEFCSGSGPNCPGDQQVSCDDGEFCTLDSCDPTLPDVCVHDAQAMDYTKCNDSDACTVFDRCMNGTCGSSQTLICLPSANQCTTRECDAALGCVEVFRTGSCDDGNACTAGETCDETTWQCRSSLYLNCDDFNACTADSCDPDTGCVNELIPCGELPFAQRFKCKHCISRGGP